MASEVSSAASESSEAPKEAESSSGIKYIIVVVVVVVLIGGVFVFLMGSSKESSGEGTENVKKEEGGGGGGTSEGGGNGGGDGGGAGVTSGSPVVEACSANDTNFATCNDKCKSEGFCKCEPKCSCLKPIEPSGCKEKAGNVTSADFRSSHLERLGDTECQLNLVTNRHKGQLLPGTTAKTTFSLTDTNDFMLKMTMAAFGEISVGKIENAEKYTFHCNFNSGNGGKIYFNDHKNAKDPQWPEGRPSEKTFTFEANKQYVMSFAFNEKSVICEFEGEKVMDYTYGATPDNSNVWILEPIKNVILHRVQLEWNDPIFCAKD